MDHRKISDGQWCWLEKKQLDHIQNVLYEGKPLKIRTARSILLAFAETSSDNGNKTEFSSFRFYIATKASVSLATFDRYTKVFEMCGFIKKIPVRNGRKLSACKWQLLAFRSTHHYDDTKEDDKSHYIHNNDETRNHISDEVVNKNIKKERGIEFLRSELKKKGII